MSCNKTVGNAFERVFCRKLADAGFWVLNVPQTAAGQPADVIAAKNGTAYLIDCKVCSGNSFPLRRIEENQANAMTLFQQRGNDEAWFALLIEGEIYMAWWSTLQRWIEQGYAAVSIKDVQSYFSTLKEWLEWRS